MERGEGGEEKAVMMLLEGREREGEKRRGGWMDGGIKKESTGLAYEICGTTRYTALYGGLYGERCTPG